MKNYAFLILTIFLSMLTSCSGNAGLCEKYTCVKSNGKFGSVLKFKKGGKLFLDLVSNELAERNLNLRNKLDVAGEYEVIGDKIIIKYFNGFQTHTLNKIGDKLTSNTDNFRVCSCESK